MRDIASFEDAHAELRQFYKNTRTNYDLNLMRQLMAFLGNPQDKLRVVHVAGTSGKTSTAYYMASLLQMGGSKVGLTVSPHVDEINERVQVGGKPMEEAAFCRELTAFLELVEGSGIRPSYFECMVAFAYWEFAKQTVDYAVVEVGLGGLLDGTNVVDRSDKVCVITDIGLDHTEVLGDTLPEIAAQKAGIIQRGNHVFMYKQGSDVVDVIRKRCDEHQAALTLVPLHSTIGITELPLFQQRNLGLSVQVVNYIRNRDGKPALSSKDVRQAGAITVPARMEQFELAGRTLVVDGSHNAQKLAVLAESIHAKYPGQNVAALVAFVEGNDSRWQGGIQEVIKLADRIIVTSFYSEKDFPKKSVDPTLVADYCRQQGYHHVTVVDNPKEALAELEKSGDPLLLVAGSFYLLNHIRPLLT